MDLRAAKLHMIMRGCHATTDANCVHLVMPPILIYSTILGLIQYKNPSYNCVLTFNKIFWRICQPTVGHTQYVYGFA